MVRLAVVSHRLPLAFTRAIVRLPERTVALVARIVGDEAKSVALGHEFIAAGHREADVAPIRVGAPIRSGCPGTIMVAIGATAIGMTAFAAALVARSVVLGALAVALSE